MLGILNISQKYVSQDSGIKKDRLRRPNNFKAMNRKSHLDSKQGNKQTLNNLKKQTMLYSRSTLCC
jgi:hypothetical protein